MEISTARRLIIFCFAAIIISAVARGMADECTKFDEDVKVIVETGWGKMETYRGYIEAIERYAEIHEDACLPQILFNYQKSIGAPIELEKAGMLVESMKNILASCDTGAVLFFNTNDIPLVATQISTNFRSDVTTIFTISLVSERYRRYLKEKPRIASAISKVEAMDISKDSIAVNLGRILRQMNIPINEIPVCGFPVLPPDSMLQIGFVYKNYPADSEFIAMRKTLDMIEQGLFGFDQIYRFKPPLDVDYVNYGVAMYPNLLGRTAYLLDSLGRENEAEKEIFTRVDSALCNMWPWILSRRSWATRNDRADHNFWEKKMREKWMTMPENIRKGLIEEGFKPRE